MKTKILKIKGDWEEVVNDCRSTVGKPPLARLPGQSFKKAILISEHSPIRDISVKWFWNDIPSWVATHFSRHKWECFVRTQRSDRTGISRDKMPQDSAVDMTGEANVQHLIDTARKRLCMMASPKTRSYMEDLKISIHEKEPEIADVMVPNCVYRCGCPEINGCGLYDTLKAMYPDIASTDIQKRYDCYNKIVYSERS